MNVVCASDTAFVPHMATMLLSLARNGGKGKIKVFILFEKYPFPTDEIRTMLREYSLETTFISIDEAFPQELPATGGHVNKFTYARLLIDRFLPTEMEKVLYLDCDTIIRRDLKELWNHGLAGKTVAAVRDIVPFSNHLTLGLPAGAPYFNAGVMLIDLRRWRRQAIGQRALDFVCRHPERILWWDQCALNLTLYSDWLALDPIWNFQTMEVGRYSDDIIRFERMSDDLRKSVRIAHFTSNSKPWHYLNYHPLKEEYLGYRKNTPWPLEKFHDRYPRSIIRRFLYRHLPYLVPLYHLTRKII